MLRCDTLKKHKSDFYLIVFSIALSPLRLAQNAMVQMTIIIEFKIDSLIIVSFESSVVYQICHSEIFEV